LRHYLIAGPLLATAFTAAPALAGEDVQHWETLNVSVGLPDDFRLSSETIVRTSDARGLYEVEQNLMVGKKVNKKVTVWLGYTFNPTYLQGTFRAREHRFRQQVNFDNVAAIGPVRVGGRLRLEERWREGQTGTAWRLRPQVKATLPLQGKFSLSVAHESFIDLNTTSFQRVGGYERMRNSISLGVPLTKNFNLDVGYLNQHAFVPDAADTSDHAITLGLNASF